MWIVKVGDQYLAWRDGGSAGCSQHQKDAVRFPTAGLAYKTAHRTFGLADEDDEDDMSARVVRLTEKKR